MEMGLNIFDFIHIEQFATYLDDTGLEVIAESMTLLDSKRQSKLEKKERERKRRMKMDSLLSNLLGEKFPVAVSLAFPLVCKHLQFILIKQLIGDFQNGRMGPEWRGGETRRLMSFNQKRQRAKQAT